MTELSFKKSIMVTNLDNSTISFPQDERISFQEEGHIYLLDGTRVLTPVSTVYNRHFVPFDSDYWAPRKAAQEGISAQEMKERWDCNALRASCVGTHMHKQIEEYLNGDHDMNPYCLFTYNGQHVNVQEPIGIHHEIELFHKFVKEVDFTPFRTEWRVFDEELGIAGTIDLACSCGDGTYELYDWKRSKSLINECGEVCLDNRYHTRGINGLEHVPDTSYWHYVLQQNLYKRIVEKNYGLTIGAMHLVVLHPRYSSYHVIDVPCCPHEVDIILTEWKRSQLA